jgi:hypothetical protein
MKKSRYTLWGPIVDSYGWKCWGVNDHARVPGAGPYNISGKGYDTRKAAMAELQALRRKEQGR